MDYSKDLSPDVRRKMKLNVVYLIAFSVTMLFAGLTSAYIVSMGAGFWLKYSLPNAFYWSTLFIGLSSLSFVFALKFAKNDKPSLLKLTTIITLVLGLMFVYFQIRGFNKLIEKGVHFARNYIMVTDGRYGDYFEIKYKNGFVEVDGNDYKINGREMNQSEFKELQDFTAQFINPNQKVARKVKENNNFTLLLNGSPLFFKKQTLFGSDSLPLSFVNKIRLGDLAINIRDKRGDFFTKGKYGKDFTIFFKGKALEYKNRNLFYNKKVLSPSLQIKASEAADSASSYLYILTLLHFLHVIVTLIFLLVLVINSFSNKYNSNNYFFVLTTSVFWHFLGILWLYLLLFLVFIH